MAKQTTLDEEKEPYYPTIEEWFKPLLKEDQVRIFHLVFDGQITAATPKRPARGAIIFPRDLGNTTNLKFLDDWQFYVIGIPRKVIKNLPEEEEKKGGKKE